MYGVVSAPGGGQAANKFSTCYAQYRPPDEAGVTAVCCKLLDGERQRSKYQRLFTVGQCMGTPYIPATCCAVAALSLLNSCSEDTTAPTDRADDAADGGAGLMSLSPLRLTHHRYEHARLTMVER